MTQYLLSLVFQEHAPREHELTPDVAVNLHRHLVYRIRRHVFRFFLRKNLKVGIKEYYSLHICQKKQ